MQDSMNANVKVIQRPFCSSCGNKISEDGHEDDCQMVDLMYGEDPWILYALAKGRLALIRSRGGKVCGRFETCRHKACESSYGTWAIADEVLKKLATKEGLHHA